jgi:hypothetical protein
MKVNSVNSTNLQQNKTKIQAELSFTSVLPARVFIDGNPSTDAENIKRAVRALSEILFKPSNDSKTAEIKHVFSEYDRDFHSVESAEDKSNVLRTRVLRSDGISYLFTGPQAQKLDELGREIGPAKAKGLRIFGTTKTFEAMSKVRDYFGKIRQFIDSNMVSHVHERINPQTRAYEGEKLGLHIHAKSEGTPGKKGFKLTIDNIFFRKIKENHPSANISKKHAA